MKLRVISGGQTGADVAGLWVAKFFGLETGGLAPGNFMTLLGPRPDMVKTFGMTEGPAGYRDRTRENVKKADVTLVFSRMMKSPGTVLTINTAHKLGKHVFAFQDSRSENTETVTSFWEAQAASSTTSLMLAVEAVQTMITKRMAENRISLLEGMAEDEVFTINIAGNASKNFRESFEFAFVGFWYFLEALSDYLSVLGKEKVLKPAEVMMEFKDQYSPALLNRVEELCS